MYTVMFIALCFVIARVYIVTKKIDATSESGDKTVATVTRIMLFCMVAGSIAINTIDFTKMGSSEEKYYAEERQKILDGLPQMGSDTNLNKLTYEIAIKKLDALSHDIFDKENDQLTSVWADIVSSRDSLKQLYQPEDYKKEQEAIAETNLNYKHIYTDEDIDKQFHPYDGAHIKTEEFVESNLKDPDSYEHVKSEYKIHDDYLEVKLTYRGKNAFNATVTESIRTKCDLATGEVLKIIK